LVRKALIYRWINTMFVRNREKSAALPLYTIKEPS
jgi:hypothetical protein